MQKSKTAIESSSKWSGLRAYLELVEANKDNESGIALDGAKSLIESVAKTVLADRGVAYASDDSVGKLVKMAAKSLPSFGILEIQDADTLTRLISGLESVTAGIGTLRNRHGTVGHGQDLHDRRIFDSRLAQFAIDCADNIAGFLMEAHTAEPDGIKRLRYEDQTDFNAQFDEQQEEIEIAGVIISPSRALFEQDIEAYKETVIDFGQKENLITSLETSAMFATTHGVIARLTRHKDFSDGQVRRLVEIGCTNTQVSWIMQDEDVRAFYAGLLRDHTDVIMATEHVESLLSLMGDDDPSELNQEELAEVGKLGVIDETKEMGHNITT